MYHEVMLAIALLDALAAPLALLIAYKVFALHRLIGSRGLLLLGLGFSALSAALIFSGIAGYLAYSEAQTTVEPEFPMGHGWMHGMPHPWPAGEESVSWDLVSYAGLVFPLAYALILAGILVESVEVEEPGSQGGVLALSATGLLLGGDAFSISILSMITFNKLQYSRLDAGTIGYMVMLVSHILRLLAVVTGTAWLIALAEALRPSSLLAIVAGLRGGQSGGQG